MNNITTIFEMTYWRQKLSYHTYYCTLMDPHEKSWQILSMFFMYIMLSIKQYGIVLLNRRYNIIYDSIIYLYYIMWIT